MMVQTPKQRSSSVEDYLKTIASLSREEKGATVTDISKVLGVKKPSVTSALERMSREGLVVHQKYGAVRLTPQGAKAAQDVDHRHHILCHLLIDILKVEPSIAEEDAHLMEHALSQSSLEKLEEFVEFIMNNAGKKKDSRKRVAPEKEKGKRKNGG